MSADVMSTASRLALRAAMTDPRRTYRQQYNAAQQLLAEALKDEPGFRLPTEAEQAADAAHNKLLRKTLP